MARPAKSRKICYYPEITEFYPGIIKEESEYLTIDEYETIRLIDQMGFSQEESSGFMDVARATIQRSYENARRKISNAIIKGSPLNIEGGDVWICDGQSVKGCVNPECYKRYYHEKYKKERKSNVLRIAIPFGEYGQVFQLFEGAENIRLYDVEGDKIVNVLEISLSERKDATLTGILNAVNADVLLCGAVSRRTQTVLSVIKVYTCCNITGNADRALSDFLKNINSICP